jgi:hypothetical protein
MSAFLLCGVVATLALQLLAVLLLLDAVAGSS